MKIMISDGSKKAIWMILFVLCVTGAGMYTVFHDKKITPQPYQNDTISLTAKAKIPPTLHVSRSRLYILQIRDLTASEHIQNQGIEITKCRKLSSHSTECMLHVQNQKKVNVFVQDDHDVSRTIAEIVASP